MSFGSNGKHTNHYITKATKKVPGTNNTSFTLTASLTEIIKLLVVKTNWSYHNSQTDSTKGPLCTAQCE
jgi:hypothetical protein